MVPELRKEEILKSIKKRDISYIKDLAAELNISLSTVRRDVAALEQEGSVIVMRGGAVKYKAEDFDEPVVSVSCWEEKCGMIWNPYWAP